MTAGGGSILTTRRVVGFSLFFATFLAIVALIVLSGNLLIAPPYAVTVYLVIFARRTAYARPQGIAASYLLVLVTAALFQFTLGVTVLALVANVLVVSLFITFSPLSHPPALALTIFSFIAHDTLSFTETSIVVLLIVLALSFAIEKLEPLRTALQDPESARVRDDAPRGEP